MSAAIMTKPAGFLRRLAAAGYDLLLLIAIWMLVTALFLPFNDGNAPVPGSVLFAAHRFSLLAITALFFVGFWRFGGQTLGMRAWRLKVVRDDGKPMDWGNCIRRLAASLVSLLPAGAGLWWALFDRENRAWHDKLSHTHLQWLGQRPGQRLD